MTSNIIKGVLALGMLAGGFCTVNGAAAAVPAPAGTLFNRNMNSMTLENEYITVNVDVVSRKLASVTVQDKINGRTYDLGSDIFSVTTLDENTDEACSKKEQAETTHDITARDMQCSAPVLKELAPVAVKRRRLRSY